MTSNDLQISFDQPLQPGKALVNDTLLRRTFAENGASALRKVSSSAGFVLSIEGAWGSGKTSVLAMIEELLQQEEEIKRPIIVHFNPWLVGDRDALLRQFLARIASAVKLSDRAKEGKKLAREIKAYAKAFDVIKLIPGAEPWASMVKSLTDTVGEVAGAIGEYKTLDLEQQKRRVEEALQKFPYPIIVFIDDIDRLFPREVFEMIRIIKAVGELPHVGYVLAWDPSYVSAALASVDVPQADTYLDKIVQVRMPLPSLTLSARNQLIDTALAELPSDALKSRFKDDGNRLSHLYFSGLRELLEQPRDVTRVFNTVRVIEPALRGEIVFADIVGLAALMVKATPVFELLRKQPSYFVGSLPHDFSLMNNSKELVEGSEAKSSRQKAYEASPAPINVRRVIHFLFPMVAKAEGAGALTRVSDVAGHLAHPSRLLVALQLSISSSDVSIESAKTYLQQPSLRESTVQCLTEDNCLEFFELLGDVANYLGGAGISDLEELCLSVASLADKEPFSTRSRNRNGFFTHNAEDVALRVIKALVQSSDPKKSGDIAQLIVESESSLSVAASLIRQCHDSEYNDDPSLLVLPKQIEHVLTNFSQNVLKACRDDKFFSLANPGFILWTLARAVPSDCSMVYQALKSNDPMLDKFALEFFQHSYDSTKGQTYSLPDDVGLLASFCPLDEFMALAATRLTDDALDYPARAAWRAVVERKKLYAVDGSEANR